MTEEQESTSTHIAFTADFVTAQVYLAFKLVCDAALWACSRYSFHQSLSILPCDLTVAQLFQLIWMLFS